MIAILIMIAFGKPLVKSGLGRRKSDAFQWKLFWRTGVSHLQPPKYSITGDVISLPFSTDKAIDFQSPNLSFRQYSGPSDPLFDAHISVLEVKKAIDTAKRARPVE